MAIYIKAKKESETDLYVIYNYGTNPENLKSRLKLFKSDFKVKILSGNEEIKADYTSMLISAKIYGYYQQKGFYPEEISKES